MLNFYRYSIGFGFLICLFLFVGQKTLRAQNAENGIVFNASLKRSLHDAAQMQKFVFVDVYADWCGPCKMMDKYIFTNDTVARFFNANFINVKLNTEIGEGIDVAQTYGIVALPTFLVFNKQGELVIQKAGSYNSAQSFINFGIEALNSDKCYACLQNKFLNHTITIDELSAWILIKANNKQDFTAEEKLFDALFDTTHLKKPVYWDMLRNRAVSLESKLFDYFKKQAHVYTNEYTQDSVNQVLLSVFIEPISSAAIKAQVNRYHDLRQQLMNLKIPHAAQFLMEADLALYYALESWPAYIQTMNRYFQKYTFQNLLPFHTYFRYYYDFLTPFFL